MSKKPKCTCDKFFTERSLHENGCKLAILDMQLNDFGNYLVVEHALLTNSNEVAIQVNKYINQLPTK